MIKTLINNAKLELSEWTVADRVFWTFVGVASLVNFLILLLVIVAMSI